MEDLMREMNGNIDDKLNNGKSNLFSLQARAMIVYPVLENHQEYVFKDSRIFETCTYVNKVDNPEVLNAIINKEVSMDINQNVYTR